MQTPSLFEPYFTIKEVDYILSEPFRVIQEVTLQTPSLFVPYFTEITIEEVFVETIQEVTCRVIPKVTLKTHAICTIS